MDIKPYVGRLVAGVKNAIVEFVMLAIGWLMGVVVAEQWCGYERYGWYWTVTMAAVWLAYTIVVWLLKRAWARYRRAPN